MTDLADEFYLATGLVLGERTLPRVAAFVAAREAAARREGIEVLAELLRWFGKYPEFIPHPDHANKVDAAIKRARALLDAQPDADLARDYHAWTEGRSDER